MSSSYSPQDKHVLPSKDKGTWLVESYLTDVHTPSRHHYEHQTDFIEAVKSDALAGSGNCLFLKIKFANKEIDTLCFCNILNRFVKEKLHCLNEKHLLQNTTPCKRSISESAYNPSGEVTGDLNVVSTNEFQNLLKKKTSVQGTMKEGYSSTHSLSKWLKSNEEELKRNRQRPEHYVLKNFIRLQDILFLRWSSLQSKRVKCASNFFSSGSKIHVPLRPYTDLS